MKAFCFLLLFSVSAFAAKPNIIVIFVDDFGNGDLGCFGSKLHRTPKVDRLAAEGRKFTSFYVTAVEHRTYFDLRIYLSGKKERAESDRSNCRHGECLLIENNKTQNPCSFHLTLH